MGRGSRTRRGPCRCRHVAYVDEFVEPGAEQGCGERVQVRLAGKVDVQGLKPSCCREQWAGGVVAAGGHEDRAGHRGVRSSRVDPPRSGRGWRSPAAGARCRRRPPGHSRTRHRGRGGCGRPGLVLAPSRGSGMRRQRRDLRAPGRDLPSARARRPRPRRARPSRVPGARRAGPGRSRRRWRRPGRGGPGGGVRTLAWW